jgi:outer membrane protein TolC
MRANPSPAPRRRRARHAAAALAALALWPVPATAQPQQTLRLSLGDAARLGARQSAAAEGARLRAEQAHARVTQRRAELLPAVSALAAHGRRTINTAALGFDFPSVPGLPPFFDPDGEVVGPVTTADLRGRVSQSLLDLGAIRRVRTARASARAVDAEAEAAAEMAAAAAATAYVRLLRADADVRARGADSLLADSLLGIARDLLRSGVGVAIDVTRARAQAAGVRAQLIAARAARDRARLELLRALGLPLDAVVALADSLAEPAAAAAAPDERDAIERALRARPDLRAAEEQLRTAEQQAAAIRAERLPTVGVFADDGFIGRRYDHLLNTYAWGVQLSLPLFDGFRRAARVDEQQALAREIDVRRRDLRQRAAIEVRAALLDVAAAREQADAARERLRLAEQELAQAGDRFRAGVAGSADVIAASLALTGARTLVTDALAAYHLARVSLAGAQGSVRELP